MRVALIDPPNRERFTDGAPRRLTYAQADRMVSAIAGPAAPDGPACRCDRRAADGQHGRRRADAARHHARRHDRDAAAAVVAAGRSESRRCAGSAPTRWWSAAGSAAPITSNLAMNIAAEIFPVRYVCGFGRNPPDGVIPFDDLYDVRGPDPAIGADRADEPGAHLAVITWDQTAERPRAGRAQPCRSDRRRTCHPARSPHRAGRRRSSSTLTLSSFAALAISVVPWLLFGSTLALHQPFDPGAFRVQRKTLGCAHRHRARPAGRAARAGRAIVRGRRASQRGRGVGARRSGFAMRRPGAIPPSA